jgi:tetratricopeptide (TPR) repeat protein
MKTDYSDSLSQSKLNELLACKSLGCLTNHDALELIGNIIDLSEDCAHSEGIDHAFKLCDELTERKLDDRDVALLYYFRANAWAVKLKCKSLNRKEQWSWDQPELREELLHLRSAICCEGFSGLDEVRKCQIYTNAANLSNKIGRFIEAVEYWNRALEINPRFGMALGNRGYGLKYYASNLYDQGHATLMMKFAHDDLRHAIGPDAFFESPNYDEVKNAMRQTADWIATHINLKVISNIDLGMSNFGLSEAEGAYRNWCLKNTLFLSPINDLGQYSIASHDVLTLPNMVVEINEPPSLIGFYNQLKQEYVAARYFYYEGIIDTSPHFADKDVLLYDTLDYPAYSIAVERIKVAYRMAYSLFDKIAYFINAYWKLDMKERDISIRRVWYNKKIIRDCFSNYENWPLRGLYWLSKDILETDNDLKDIIEPDAKHLNTIRNHLEHKYLQLHNPPWTAKGYTRFSFDDLAYPLARADLEAKALKMVKLARAGLIYLSLAVHQEERIRAQQRGNGFVAPMSQIIFPDEWKR